MPKTARVAAVAASKEQVFEMISDPNHLGRWWPGVTRVEAVVGDCFTLVMPTKKGRPMRVDFRTVEREAPNFYAWEQDLIGTPFERVLAQHLTTVELHGHGEHTHIVLEERQKLKGYALFGSWMLRRANKARLDGALDNLVEIFGDGSHH